MGVNTVPVGKVELSFESWSQNVRRANRAQVAYAVSIK